MIKDLFTLKNLITGALITSITMLAMFGIHILEIIIGEWFTTLLAMIGFVVGVFAIGMIYRKIKHIEKYGA